MNPKFYIIVTGWNCEKYVRRCIDSFLSQTYQNFDVTFINDGSTDKTGDLLYEHCKGTKFLFHNYTENKFAAFRRYQAIAELNCGPEDIIMTVDLDDRLKARALEVIKRKYEEKETFMTIGNWIDQHKRIQPTPLRFTEQEKRDRDFRKVPYRPVSPNTFRKKLWDKIPYTDYMGPDGKWLEVCTETGFRMSCLEMSGIDRVGIITDPIYVYNCRRADGSQRKHGQAYKDSIRDFVFSQPKKALYEQQPNITMPNISELASLV